MTFSSKLPEETPQSLWKDLSERGARMIMTIPCNSKVEDMSGFISICGDQSDLPILTVCVETPLKNKCIVSNIVFSSPEHYESILNKLVIDFSCNFNVLSYCEKIV